MGFAKVTSWFALLALQCAALCSFVNEVTARPNAPNAGGKQPAISLQQLYGQFRNQSTNMLGWQLMMMFATATDEDDLYDTEVDISAECRRTSQALMKLYLQFVTHEDAEKVIDATLDKTIGKIQNGSQTEHPFNLFCAEADQQLRANVNLSSAYTRLKDSTNNTAPKANRIRYFDHVVNTDTQPALSYSKFLFVPAFVEVVIREQFDNQLDTDTALNSTYNVLARAIIKVAKTDAYKDKVERIRERVSSAMATIYKTTPVQDMFLAGTDTYAFLPKMMNEFEKYFDEDPDLRRELQNAKTNV